MSEEKKNEVVQYKVSEDTKRRAQAAYDASGFEEKGEFYAQLLSLFELQLQRDGSSGYKEQLDELNYHSRRFVELYLSMIQTEAARRMEMTQQHDELLAKVSLELRNALDEIQELKTVNKQKDISNQELIKNTDSQKSLIEQLESLRKKDEELSEGYKTQIRDLSSLLSEQKGAADAGRSAIEEAEQLRADLKELQKSADRGIIELNEVKERFEYQLKQKDEKHASEIEKLTSRAALDLERAVLNVEKRHQTERDRDSAEYAERIRKLLDGQVHGKTPPPPSNQISSDSE
ncbi:hypothetical protein [Cohnella soli]|uniref:Uncharacterized protein n=1 Tax=Cohnella soli TaxID=425005 RepID=A0ABW0HN34_9BACL